MLRRALGALGASGALGLLGALGFRVRARPYLDPK